MAYYQDSDTEMHDSDTEELEDSEEESFQKPLYPSTLIRRTKSDAPGASIPLSFSCGEIIFNDGSLPLCEEPSTLFHPPVLPVIHSFHSDPDLSNPFSNDSMAMDTSPYKPPNQRSISMLDVRKHHKPQPDFLTITNPPPNRPAPPKPLHAFADCPQDIQRNREIRKHQVAQQSQLVRDQESKPIYTTGDGKPLTRRVPLLHRSEANIPRVFIDENRARFNSIPIELEHPIDHPLPVVINTERDITAETVMRLIRGDFYTKIDEYLIIDCRYLYEFQGGHIKGALNIIPAETEEILFEKFMRNPILDRKVAIVFHCEFSSKRGPEAWGRLRNMDRHANSGKYPYVYYPYVYVMQGGYHNFFSQYPKFCSGGYVEMKDKRFSRALQENKRQSKRCKDLRSKSQISESGIENVSPLHSNVNGDGSRKSFLSKSQGQRNRVLACASFDSKISLSRSTDSFPTPTRNLNLQFSKHQ